MLLLSHLAQIVLTNIQNMAKIEDREFKVGVAIHVVVS